MLYTNQTQNNKLTLESVYDSLCVKDSLILEKNNALIKSLGTLEQKITSYETKSPVQENQFSVYNNMNLILSGVIGALLIWILLILLFRKRRKIYVESKVEHFDPDTLPDKDNVLKIFEILHNLEDKINKQAGILNELRKGNYSGEQPKVNEEEINKQLKTIKAEKTLEESPPGRYLIFDSDSYYKEIFVSDKPTSFYESKYYEKDKISEVSIIDNIPVKSSAAKSRLTPLFDVDGDYGNAVLKKPAKITWQGNKGQLHERGKIKLVE
jgi:hypothetical protein